MGRTAPVDDSQVALMQVQVKQKLQGIHSQDSMIMIFKAVLGNEIERSALLSYFEKIHAAELPHFIQHFIKWENDRTKKGAEFIFRTYFTSESPLSLDVKVSDKREVQLLLHDYESNIKLIHDLFQKYALVSMQTIKENYNPKQI